jgi:hypothetical protein
MSKPTPEEIERSRRESCETIRRIDQMQPYSPTNEAVETVTTSDALAEAPTMPVLTRNQRDRYELEQRDAELEWERKHERRDHRLDTRMLSVSDVQTLIAAALAEERAVVIPVIRQALDELLDQEREHHTSKLAERTRGLELQIAKLEAAVSALELALNVERGRVLDLPSPLKAVN